MNNNIFLTRRKKLWLLKKNGFNYPNNFLINISIKNINNIYKKYDREILNKNLNLFSLAGRIYNKRIMSKNTLFIDIKDNKYKIQLYINKTKLKKNNIINDLKLLDIGDIIGIKGNIFKTYTNELSIKVIELYLLTKSLKSLPSKYYKLVNKEECIRKRYLDILINEKSRDTFLYRIKIIKLIRKYLEHKGFLEVETPILHPLVGGALAKPFITHHNSLNISMYLRIAPELYLKKLIIAGFNKIFEIGKNFRNEGISTIHNPEFTMVELYITYKDMYFLMFFLEKLIKFLIKHLSIKSIHKFNKFKINLLPNPNYLKITMYDAIINYFNCKINNNDLTDYNKLLNLLKILKINNIKKFNSTGEIVEYIFSKFVVKTLIQPTFIYHYPKEVSPLAKENNKNNLLVDRFELFIAGHEIANGFSELNDVEEQSKRFLYQLKINNKLNKYDKDYIEALEYGLPPTAGLGIGIDRLVMILTNNINIRDVIFFPILKSK